MRGMFLLALWLLVSVSVPAARAVTELDTGCVPNFPNPGQYWVSIYFGTGSAAVSETSSLCGLTVSPGYLVLLSGGDPTSLADQKNSSLWAEVAVWTPDPSAGGLAKSVTLETAACDCFPTVNSVFAASYFFLVMDTDRGVTRFTPSGALDGLGYQFQTVGSTAPAQSPEPATLLTGASALFIFFIFAKPRAWRK
jgi:hypothetical protein